MTDTDKVSLQGTLIVVHGPPGIGKTQLASKFPGPHRWWASEPGHKFIPDDQEVIPLEPGQNAWPTFLSSLSNAPKKRTLVVDTIGGLFDLCEQHICAKYGWTHPSDAPHGKGWSVLKTEFARGLSKLSWLADKHKSTLVFIAHSKIETIETATSSTEKISLDLTGTARKVVVPIPDHIWFMGYADLDPSLNSDTHERALFLDGTPGIEAKCRDDRVVKKRIRPLSKKNPYKQILAVLNRRTKES